MEATSGRALLAVAKTLGVCISLASEFIFRWKRPSLFGLYIWRNVDFVFSRGTEGAGNVCIRSEREGCV